MHNLHYCIATALCDQVDVLSDRHSHYLDDVGVLGVNLHFAIPVADVMVIVISTEFWICTLYWNRAWSPTTVSWVE